VQSTQLRIEPSFHPSSLLELIQDESGCWVGLTYTTELHEKKTETIPFTDATAAAEIFRLSEGIIRTARKDDRLILDGVSLCCIMELDGEEKQYKFRCPENGTSELKLVYLLLHSIFSNCSDNLLIRSFENTALYFDAFMPFRMYDGTVFRLRMYHRITSGQKKEFDKAVQQTLQHEQVLLDMTHLKIIDDYLLDALKPFMHRPGVTWQVRRRFVQELLQAGLAETAMIWIAAEPGEEAG
jgi:hypothetical protein